MEWSRFRIICHAEQIGGGAATMNVTLGNITPTCLRQHNETLSVRKAQPFHTASSRSNTSNMALTASMSATDVKEKFAEFAYIAINDTSIGERVREFQQKGFPIETAEGLDFCQRNVIADEVRIFYKT